MDDAVVVLAREWFVKASEDLAAAKLLMQGKLNGSAMFHCQQAVEKSIKGYLLFHGLEFPKTHDLVQLLQIALPLSSDWSGWDEIGDALTECAVEVRYPGSSVADVDLDKLFAGTVGLMRVAAFGVAPEVVQGLGMT